MSSYNSNNINKPIILVEVSSNTISLSQAYADPNLHNEETLKVKCGLGRYLDDAQELNPYGVKLAFKTLDKWFKKKSMQMTTPPLDASRQAHCARLQMQKHFSKSLKNGMGKNLKS